MWHYMHIEDGEFTCFQTGKLLVSDGSCSVLLCWPALLSTSSCSAVPKYRKFSSSESDIRLRNEAAAVG